MGVLRVSRRVLTGSSTCAQDTADRREGTNRESVGFNPAMTVLGGFRRVSARRKTHTGCCRDRRGYKETDTWRESKTGVTKGAVRKEAG